MAQGAPLDLGHREQEGGGPSIAALGIRPSSASGRSREERGPRPDRVATGRSRPRLASSIPACPRRGADGACYSLRRAVYSGAVQLPPAGGASPRAVARAQLLLPRQEVPLKPRFRECPPQVLRRREDDGCFATV